MKLVIATPSPFARKVRVALREKNIEFNEVVDVPWNKDTITKNFNPLGKIPILMEENKESLFDSKVIVQYLDHINEAQLMYPKDPQDNISARLIESVADGVCDAIVLVFLENSRNETLRSNDWVQRQEKKIYEGTKYLSDHLGNKKYFVGGHFNIADVCAFSCLEYLDLRFIKFNWKTKYPNLEKYWVIHKYRPSFLNTKPQVQTIEPLVD